MRRKRRQRRWETTWTRVTETRSFEQYGLPVSPSPVSPATPASRITVERAAEIAGLADDIEEFPGKYEQLVGERGITLSGGQKQRTAIARAIMRDPRILILDDSLSAVDTYTEEKILHNLRDVRDRSDDADRFAPNLDHQGRRPDLCASRRPHHRTRHSRRTARASTANTPTSMNASCSKRNWRRPIDRKRHQNIKT